MLESDLLAGADLQSVPRINKSTDCKSAPANPTRHFQLSIFNFQFITLFVLFFCLSRIAFSQGIRDSVFTLQQIDVSAGRLFNKETAGMTETKVDSSVIIEKINLSLSELLSENTPIIIKSHGRGALATASFRGTAASHTQVTWNGININSPMLGMVDFSLIPVYIIDDLKLKHGAASIADNSGGLGGSINISNKADWNNRFTVKAMQGVGSYSTFDEFVSIALGNTKIQSKTRLYHNYSKNDYTFVNRLVADIDPETGDFVYPVHTNNNADYKRYGLLQEFYWRPAENNTVSVKWWSQKADRSIPRVTSYEGEEGAIINRQNNVDNNIVADWKRYGSRSNLSVSSAFTNKQYDYFLKYFVGGDGFQSSVYSESNQQSSFNNIAYDLNVSSALSVYGNVNIDYHSVSSRDSVTKNGYRKERLDLSMFLAGRAALGKQMNLNVMLRQDRFGSQYSPIIPFLGFDIRILKDKEWIVKGSIARNYHQPTLNDLYWQPGGNSNLKPEQGTSFELGTEYLLKIKNHELTARITGFRNDVNDWIIWTPSIKVYWEAENIKNVLSEGFETNIKSTGIFGKVHYKMLCSYTYTSSVNNGDPLVWGDNSIGKQLPFIPVHSGNMFASLSRSGFTASWQFNANSIRFMTSSNELLKRKRLPAYFMNDISIGKSIIFNICSVDINFKIYNLFDEIYHSILIRPMPRRNYSIVVSVTI